MSDFNKKQIKAYYDWRYRGTLLPEDSPQNLHEVRIHHINCMERIETLKAEKDEQKASYELIIEAHLKHITELRGQVERVRALPEKWRYQKLTNHQINCNHYEKGLHTAKINCANELEQALAPEKTDE